MPIYKKDLFSISSTVSLQIKSRIASNRWHETTVAPEQQEAQERRANDNNKKWMRRRGDNATFRR